MLSKVGYKQFGWMAGIIGLLLLIWAVPMNVSAQSWNEPREYAIIAGEQISIPLTDLFESSMEQEPMMINYSDHVASAEIVDDVLVITGKRAGTARIIAIYSVYEHEINEIAPVNVTVNSSLGLNQGSDGLGVDDIVRYMVANSQRTFTVGGVNSLLEQVSTVMTKENVGPVSGSSEEYHTLYMSDQELVLNLDDFFFDEDGDTLSYGKGEYEYEYGEGEFICEDNNEYFYCEIEGNTLRIMATGEHYSWMHVRINATDGQPNSESATMMFVFETVEPLCERVCDGEYEGVNSSPYVLDGGNATSYNGENQRFEVFVGGSFMDESPLSFNLNDFFADYDGDELTFEIVSGMEGGQEGSVIDGGIDGQTLYIYMWSAGFAEFQIVATDEQGASSVPLTFIVTVAGSEQQPPAVTIP
jgi:hypothetical protein